MASCSSTDEKLRAMIPNDALGVVKINMPSVLEKAGIKNGDGADALSIPSELKQVIDQLVNHLLELGRYRQSISAIAILYSCLFKNTRHIDFYNA